MKLEFLTAAPHHFYQTCATLDLPRDRALAALETDFAAILVVES